MVFVSSPLTHSAPGDYATNLWQELPMSNLSSIIHLALSGVDKPDTASVFMNLEGKEISASPIVGTKAELKDITLIGYSDDVTVDDSIVDKGWRSFDVLPGSDKVLLASGRDLNNVVAVLVVNATVLLDPPNFKAMLESPDMSDSIGPMFGEHAGLIVKHFLGSRWGERNIGGGCYFFESETDIEAYLSSEFWSNISTETPWENVTYEMYAVSD
jgi:hypothetical protein